MSPNAWTSTFAEPPPPRPARPSRLDAAVALGAALLACVEVWLREGLIERPLQLLFGVGIALTLWPRRTRPAHWLVAAFGLANALTAYQHLRGLKELGLHSSAVVVLHGYSLLRYGSGREIGVGLPAMLLTWAGAALGGDVRDLESAIGSLVVLFFPAALGASARFRELAHRRDVEHVQLEERQLLSRELHDTVAHRVTAIVLQAQGAQAQASRRPEVVPQALAAIEHEANRALVELRALVGALRETHATALSPPGDTQAIEALVREPGTHATFTREGDPRRLSPAVELALHRIARESLHNARRHARGATHIAVRLSVQGDSVRLTVRDDGALSHPARLAGFGLVGMRERAVLLGGNLEAGPHPSGGWLVEAVLPCGGLPS